MVVAKSVNRLGSIVKVLSPALLIFTSLSPQLLAQMPSEWKVSLEFPPADDRGAPERSAGGGTRGPSCVESGVLPVTALMPTRDNVGTTASTNPTLFFYVPKTIAKSAEFVVVDEQGKEVYLSSFPLAATGGIVKVHIPQSASLQVGKDFVWQFALICDGSDRSKDQFVRGTIRPIELSSDLKQKLQQASSPLEQAKLFAEARIWNETLAIVAELRNTYPTEWEQLLKSVGLEALAAEPIVDSSTAEKSQLVIGNN
ncbi:DUF928 domain-containing protein [Planktothrix sp. FACHB-1355]|uniref:DUF928 domain-containing protein n=1 Tax=Aerosakkonema funiforme FACHB-1375 TaxID=2949571 RepID=A0A926ZIM4_9CYAN|nr:MULTISPECIES: DUF928 domain-containing protein [Oscillatoriales]MBD2181941.1 DUF928 domain-containing protein [Aerosakkonema funiforme FACHB-1375]MBD3562238.1 DUF928 domain-containing protein [Planktothrix sp. FACHB-1355]